MRVDTRFTRWKMQGRKKGHWEGSVKKRASETIGRKDEAANKNGPLQDLFSLFNFQSEIQPPAAAVRHPRAGAVVGEDDSGESCSAGLSFGEISRFHYFVKLRTQKGNFFKPTWKEIQHNNGWTSNRTTPIGSSIRNVFRPSHFHRSRTNVQLTRKGVSVRDKKWQKVNWKETGKNSKFLKKKIKS